MYYDAHFRADHFRHRKFQRNCRMESIDREIKKKKEKIQINYFLMELLIQSQRRRSIAASTTHWNSNRAISGVTTCFIYIYIYICYSENNASAHAFKLHQLHLILPYRVCRNTTTDWILCCIVADRKMSAWLLNGVSTYTREQTFTHQLNMLRLI